jgi:hypothetical protein
VSKSAAIQMPDWSWLGAHDWAGTGAGKRVYAGGDQEIVFNDGGVTTSYARDLSALTRTGHLHVLRQGPPVIGDLDLLYIAAAPGGNVPVTSVTSTAGAAWTIVTFSPCFAGAYRIAAGGEPAAVTIVTSANVPVIMRTARWK